VSRLSVYCISSTLGSGVPSRGDRKTTILVSARLLTDTYEHYSTVSKLIILRYWPNDKSEKCLNRMS